MNYAKMQHDKVGQVVSHFLRDSTDPNPIVRALSIRTMSSIRVPKITQELYNPLHKCLKDQDPYVRKTAAMCVAKLYNLNKEQCEKQGFLTILNEMIFDSNHVVVANATAALTEIHDLSETQDILLMDSEKLNILLTALNKCANEWGQVVLLDTIAKYKCKNASEAENICEQIAPRLKSSNSSVVLATIKSILLFIDELPEETQKQYHRKLSPPLGTLMSAGKHPSIQFVALRNIRLILQRTEELLLNEVKIFYCKYNDPLYIKLEKLEIIVRLANKDNIKEILNEIVEYSQMGDVEFVRKSVRAIGRCAIKLQSVAAQCVKTLTELINTKVNYIVQEAIIVIRDILRRYPGKYEKVITTLCENLASLDEPEAKGAMIWIIGEYSDRISNADELMLMFLQSFVEEDPMVQLQLLTATVKAVLKGAIEDQSVLENLFHTCINSDNPDIRDRGFFYWRLVASDVEAAKDMVTAGKPVIKDDSQDLDVAILVKLLPHIGSLASLLHKPPEFFVSALKAQSKKFGFKSFDTIGIDEESSEEGDEVINQQEKKEERVERREEKVVEKVQNPLFEFEGPKQQQQQKQVVQQGGSQQKPVQQQNDIFDFLGMGSGKPVQQPVQQQVQPQQRQQPVQQDLFGQPVQQVQQKPVQQQQQNVMDFSFLGI